MKGAQVIFGLIVLVMLVGLILRYGNSSNQLFQDFNGLFGILTLQGSGGQPGAYHGA